MDATKLIEFAKVNGGAGIAIGIAIFMYSEQKDTNEKQEARLQMVEQKLYDCYMTKQYAHAETAKNEAENVTYKLTPLVAVLPEKRKQHEYLSEN